MNKSRPGQTEEQAIWIFLSYFLILESNLVFLKRLAYFIYISENMIWFLLFYKWLLCVNLNAVPTRMSLKNNKIGLWFWVPTTFFFTSDFYKTSIFYLQSTLFAHNFVKALHTNSLSTERQQY